MPRANATPKKAASNKNNLPATADAAVARLAELNKELAAASEKLRSIGDSRRAVQTELNAAKSADNFTLAQQHLDKRNELDAEKANLPAQIQSLREKAGEMHTHASTLYFAEHSPTERITVHRVTVVNPETGQDDSATYTDSSQTIQLCLGDLHFENEAYHAGSWAQSKGLFFNHSSEEVVV